MRFRTTVAAALIFISIPAMLFAQSTPLAQILPGVLIGGVTMTSGAAGTAGNPHEAHFVAAAGTQFGAPFTMNKLIAAQLSTFPIGSSSAGFVFNFDPATGSFKPASQSFGPTFAERALTNGRGRIGFGINYQHLEFTSYEGTDLHNGSLSYVLQHNDCCALASGVNDGVDPFFEGDLIQESLSLSLKNDIVAPFVSYGLTNRWDVGVVVPIVHISLSPTITSTIDRIATFSNPLIHSFDGAGSSTKVTSLSGSASGLGDIVLRTKYRFFDGAGGGLAAGLDVRVPSGDKENLLGTGAVQTRLQLIASSEVGRISPHVNFGYTFSRGDVSSSLVTFSPAAPAAGTANPATTAQIAAETGTTLADPKVPDELNYVVGVDVAVHSLLTISADFQGRTIRDIERFGSVSQSYQFRVANGGPLSTATRNTFSPISSGNLNVLMGIVDAKFNIPGTTLLLTGSVLFPLNDAGMKPKVTPVVSLDYSFSGK